MIELQEKFIGVLLNAVPSDWKSIQIHYEYFSIDGMRFEKYVAKADSEWRTIEFDPPLDAIDVLVELNAMLPQGQSEKWTWLEFSMDRSGEYKFDYNYGTPPMVAKELSHARP